MVGTSLAFGQAIATRLEVCKIYNLTFKGRGSSANKPVSGDIDSSVAPKSSRSTFCEFQVDLFQEGLYWSRTLLNLVD